MNKREISEIKKQFKKDNNAITRICGCYVDAEKQIKTTLKEAFFALSEEEIFKYYEIFKKALSGGIGKNLHNLEYSIHDEGPDSAHELLMKLRDEKLADDETVDTFYNKVIENYEYGENYYIILIHSAYDVPGKASDNEEMFDASEEVYNHILCCICPVKLSEPGLSYNETTNAIEERPRDWWVQTPMTGFLFPAFNDRSSDIHSVMFYTRDTKTPHAEFMESGLGCGTKLTATEKKLTFQSIVKEVIGEDEEESDAVFGDIQENLNNMIPVTEDETVEPEPVIVTRSAIADVLAESGVTEEQAAVIENTYENVFGEELPEAGQLVDPKLVEANGKRKEKLELVKQVENLKQQLEETRSVPVSEEDADGEDVPAVKTYDVILRVKPEKVGQIHSQVIDGQKCLVIPMDEDEHAAVNGVNTTV